MELLYAIVSVLIVSSISLVGIIALPFEAKRLRKFLIYAVSFAAGALFGDVFFHLMPELAETGFGVSISLAALSGIVISFVIEKFVHWRHCHVPTSEDHPHPFAIMNLVGDAIHNLIDGLIIGASYMVSIPAGVATTIAVALHEVPQEIGDIGVLIHGGFTKRKALLMNFLTALTALLGVGLALVMDHTPLLIGFAAGSFLYIAAADLVPEIHKETRPWRSILQLGTFLLGIGIMAALLFLE